MSFLKSYIKLLFLDKQEKEFFYFVKNQLGYTPNSIYHYRKALTHKSANIKTDKSKPFSNERLEFLGDSIMGAVISDYLFMHYKENDEGFLTQMRSKIVNRKNLNEIAVNLKLHKYVIVNNSSIDKNNILGNAFEALIGAIFLDKGFTFTQTFIVERILKKYVDFNYFESVDTNFKSRIIEYYQKRRQTIVFDSIEQSSDIKGKQMFVARILIDQTLLCEASGYSKKEAEQNAAKKALAGLQ